MRIFLLINCWQTAYKTVYMQAHTHMHTGRGKCIVMCDASRKQPFTLIQRHRHEFICSFTLSLLRSIVFSLVPFRLRRCISIYVYAIAVVPNRSFIRSHCIYQYVCFCARRSGTTVKIVGRAHQHNDTERPDMII